MRWPITRTATVGFGLTLAVFLCNTAVFYRITRQVVASQREVVRTHEVLGGLEQLRAAAAAAEAEGRVFRITGDAQYLAAYRSALTRVQEQVEELERRTAEE